MNQKNSKKVNKRKNRSVKGSLAIIAVLLVCIMTLGGTIAWLTSTSTLENKFTVGYIKPIDPNQPGPGPDGGNIPEEDRDPSKGKLNGNLYEPGWVPNSKLMPGAEITKNPYVGVGPESEKSYVYIYVDNSMKNNDKIYFTINENWKPVVDHVTVVSGSTAGQVDAKYIGGLFKYEPGLDGSAESVKNTWTAKPLFEKVIISDDATAVDFVSKTVEHPKLDGTDALGSITVKSFVHQMNDAQGAPIDETGIVIPAAIKAVTEKK